MKSLKAGVDILIATPGRLLDLCNQRHIRLDRGSILVLDEADRMLDMGFIHDVRKIGAQCRRDRQTLLFSATMPAPIAKLAHDILTDPIRVDVLSAKIAVGRVTAGSVLRRRQGKAGFARGSVSRPRAWTGC